jgi:Pyridoxamine 5'-phosphate oxidase
MAKTYECLDDDLVDWIGRQHLFFVATAPSGSGGHVNLSPKGYDSFRVLDASTVAYLDLTGSGVETIAHLRDNGRITLMFCAFEGPPKIVRLQGRGDVVVPGDPGFDDLVERFDQLPGTRAVIRVTLDRVSDSCGYSVPFMDYQGERPTLLQWAGRKGDDELDEYRRTRNAQSIDGLSGIS